MSITFHVRGSFEGQELNISNANFRVLSELLHLKSDDEDCGSIDPEILSEEIHIAREEIKQSGREWERSRSESLGEKGARIIDLPFSTQQLTRYFDRLEILIQQSNNTEIVWS